MSEDTFHVLEIDDLEEAALVMHQLLALRSPVNIGARIYTTRFGILPARFYVNKQGLNLIRDLRPDLKRVGSVSESEIGADVAVLLDMPG